MSRTPQARPGQYAVVDSRQRGAWLARGAILAFALGVLAGTLGWQTIPPLSAGERVDPPQERVAVARYRALADIADRLCADNGGADSIALPRPGTLAHHFKCRDGAQYRDITVEFGGSG